MDFEDTCATYGVNPEEIYDRVLAARDGKTTLTEGEWQVIIAALEVAGGF